MRVATVLLTLLALATACREAAAPNGRPVVAGLLAEGRSQLAIGDTAQLRVTALDSSGRRLHAVTDVRWTTTDTGVVHITPDGVVQARRAGSAHLVGTSASHPALTAGLYLQVGWPVLSIHVASPAPDTTIPDSTVRIAATCAVQSNTGRRCVSLTASAGGQLLARGTDRLDTVVTVRGPLAASIRFTATDSIAFDGGPVFTNQADSGRTVFLATAPFRLVGRFGELALDYDGSDALFREYVPGVGESTLRLRAAAEPARTVAPYPFHAPKLVGPRVVWYARQPGATFANFDLVEWRDGISSTIGTQLHHVAPVLEGNFGAWTQQEGGDTVLYRRDIAAGITTRIATGVRGWVSGTNPYYVSADGDVYFIRGTSTSGVAGVYRWRSGTAQLFRAGAFDYVRVNAGSVLLREVGGAITLLTASREEALERSAFAPLNVGETIVTGRSAGSTSTRPFTPLYDVYVRSLDDPTLTRVHAGVESVVLVRRNGDVVAGRLGVCSLGRANQPLLPLPSCAVTERDGRLFVLSGPYVLALKE